jgi:hypothetical protein
MRLNDALLSRGTLERKAHRERISLDVDVIAPNQRVPRSI